VAMLLACDASIDVKNTRGETPVSNVSAEWNAELEAVYRRVGNLLGEELNLKRIRETRPMILKMLQDHASNLNPSDESE
ncbi:MAG: hypothetical protein O3A00_27910, partial [Planctomycetota bacterium]|nr:hypothetical protein [Planctomycetota bacterium]